jgi:MEMO1 family protein
VPILVGDLSLDAERDYGVLLAPYLADPHTLFVVSSDFCHWGKRFRYTYLDPACKEIYQSIEKTDREGMRLIEAKDPQGFAKYLQTTKNTICGRHPIGVLLQANRAATLLVFRDPF